MQSSLFFIYWFKGWSLKTQFKIEFWPPVNGGQLVLEQTLSLSGVEKHEF